MALTRGRVLKAAVRAGVPVADVQVSVALTRGRVLKDRRPKSALDSDEFVSVALTRGRVLKGQDTVARGVGLGESQWL